MSIKLINIFLVGGFPLPWVTNFSTVICSVSGHSFRCVHNTYNSCNYLCVEFPGCIILFGLLSKRFYGILGQPLCVGIFISQTHLVFLSFQRQLHELEDKYKQAMVTNAQLDNIKTSHVFQIELLKEQIEEQEESLTETNRQYKDKTRVRGFC